MRFALDDKREPKSHSRVSTPCNFTMAPPGRQWARGSPRCFAFVRFTGAPLLHAHNQTNAHTLARAGGDGKLPSLDQSNYYVLQTKATSTEEPQPSGSPPASHYLPIDLPASQTTPRRQNYRNTCPSSFWTPPDMSSDPTRRSPSGFDSGCNLPCSPKYSCARSLPLQLLYTTCSRPPAGGGGGAGEGG